MNTNKDGYRQLNVRQLGSLRPGTITVYVTWIEREFNACQMPRSMYPSIFNRFRDIAVYWSRVNGFQGGHFCHVCKTFLPAYNSVKIIKIDRDFP